LHRKGRKEELNRLKKSAERQTISLFCGAKDPIIDHVAVLRNVLIK